MKTAIIIGSGFAGLSASCFLAKAGWDVTVVEKHSSPGGRARQLKADGFTFDVGPSWYWMPDVFEDFFRNFGKSVADYYELKRLDPSYAVYYPERRIDIPADHQKLREVFESIEKGSARKLDKFLSEAAFKYQAGMKNLVYKPGLSVVEFFDSDILKGVLKLDILTDMKKHVRKFFSNPLLVQLMEFPVLFLGALPQKIPALYSLMNYADMKLGTFYPAGGMYKIAEGMHSLATELGVKFRFNQDVCKINVEKGKAVSLSLNAGNAQPQHLYADVVVSAADYYFTENNLLGKEHRSYSEKYWQRRKMAPSCLLFYVGLNIKLKSVLHHSLFFDADFDKHGEEIFETPSWPDDPLFYVCVPSVTDNSAAPPGCENLFFLIPVAAGLKGDTEALRDAYFDKIVERFEERTGEKIKNSVIFKRSYSVSDFAGDYNAFKGNAYGLANTLMQTAILKPRMKSKKVKNLFYAGQLTVPGPGVPPSLISGEIVAGQIQKQFVAGNI